MIRHVILWTFKSDMTHSEKKNAASRIKKELEALVGIIDGLEECSVYTESLGGSNADIMLDSVFADEAALAAYQTHPDHIAVKDYITEVVCDRKCIDLKTEATDRF